MDNVLQIEVLLNMLNTVFARAVYFKDEALIQKLSALRHDIYYSDFDYNASLTTLKAVDKSLNIYESI